MASQASAAVGRRSARTTGTNLATQPAFQANRAKRERQRDSQHWKEKKKNKKEKTRRKKKKRVMDLRVSLFVGPKNSRNPNEGCHIPTSPTLQPSNPPPESEVKAWEFWDFPTFGCGGQKSGNPKMARYMETMTKTGPIPGGLILTHTHFRAS